MPVLAQSQTPIDMSPSADGIAPIVVNGSIGGNDNEQASDDFGSPDQLGEITVVGNRGERGWQGNDPNPTKGWRPVRDANGNLTGWERRNPQTGQKERKSVQWGSQNGLDENDFRSIPLLPELQPGYVSPPPNFGSASDWAAAFSAWLQALELYAFP
jgi:hypothetical protein